MIAYFVMLCCKMTDMLLIKSGRVHATIKQLCTIAWLKSPFLIHNPLICKAFTTEAIARVILSIKMGVTDNYQLLNLNTICEYRVCKPYRKSP